jgi:anti-sigma B factor antagonist
MDRQKFEYRLTSPIARRPDVSILDCSGEIDLATRPDFEEALRHALKAPSERVIISLAAVSYIDSNGIHVLIRAIKSAAEEKKKIDVVAAGDSSVAKIFGVTGFGRVFNLYDSLAAALANGPAA